MLAIAGRDGLAQDAYAIPLSEVAAAWPDLLGRSLLPPCPYRGLEAFTAQDGKSGVFVGREAEVDLLRNMVRAKPLVMVTGPSGVGKSSLVAAGLRPELESEGWRVATFRPGTSPFEAVARALLDAERPGAQHSLEELEHRADVLRLNGFWPVASKIAILTGQRLALVGDQFEEAFGSGTGADPLTFLHSLLPSADSAPDARVRLVCTLRADFLPDLLALPDIGSRIQDRQLNVSPMDESALTRVIVEPARFSEVTFSPGLPERIAAESSRAPGSLPLLEFTLTELWPLQQERQINFDSYHGLGGVSGALNRHAENVYHWLCEHMGLAEHRIRRVLLAMVRARDGSANAVRVTAHRTHLGDDWNVARLLAEPDHRIVVLGSAGPGTAEIAHEALIREWDRLSGWVQEDAAFQQWLSVMEERAREKDLLSAPRVAEAQSWLGVRRADIPSDVTAFIEQSSEALLRQQQHTKELLAQSQELTQQLRLRTEELEAQATLLAQQSRDLEARNIEIEDARQVLEERAEQLAVSMRYKNEFLANVSHELRTPLNVSLILAKLLADNREANLTPRQVEFAETIHGAGSDLLQLINDILDLTKVEAGRMEVSPDRIELASLVDYVVATFRPLTDEKGLQLTVRVSSELPEMIVTDDQRLLQVLRNLLANAVKFTDAGSVELAIHPAAPDVPTRLEGNGALCDAGSNLIAFSVTDTGIGISAGNMRVIFEAFKQADGTTSRKYGGTGLGLSISREIAQLLGGEIHARSKPGVGSTFTLYLPLHRGDLAAPDCGLSAKAAERPISSTRSATNGNPEVWMPEEPHEPPERPDIRFDAEKVLVVDDDVSSGFALTSILEQYGLAVLYAENGREGLQVLEEHDDVAAVLMDIMMPEMDGYAGTAAIRASPALADIPVIMLTARAMDQDRARAHAAGASAYLTKPVDLDALLTTLRTWLPSDGHESSG
ncbi:ATP-binding protein [Streptomyces sp. NPDC048410]|uniref:nSTAND1 domain-containing NTPase n=1 Tax=Streptomyces sp. NPDC048410 TaxID=3365545 RepID=UPI0037207FA3